MIQFETKYPKSALDTETVNGYARILSTQYRTWTANSFEECIRPLFYDVEEGKTGNIFFGWNMEYDLRAIFKYLPEKTLKDIVNPNKKMPKTLLEGRYQLFYVPERYCSIKDTKSADNFKDQIMLYFFNLSQFFGFLSLDAAGKQELKIPKYETEVTEYFKNFENTDDYLFHNKDELMKYCRADAVLTKKLGDYMAEHIYDLFGLDLKVFSSFASVAQELTIGGEKYKVYPHLNKETKTYKYASKAYHGGWFEVKKRGWFGAITDVDISSAYPSTMITLPHWGNGDIFELESEYGLKNSDYYGWVLCQFDCPYIPYVGFDAYEWKELHVGKEIDIAVSNPKLYYPTGSRLQIITLLEYRFLKEYGYPVIFYKGDVWRENSNKKDKYPKPFLWVKEAYDRKAEIKKASNKKSYEYSLNKITMTSGYGKTCQQVGAPRMQNMLYASYITAECRVKIIKLLLDNNLEDKFIMIATDGIVIEGHHDLKLGKGLGGWDIEYYDAGLILASGIYELVRAGFTRLDNLNVKPVNKIAMRGLNKQKNLKESDHDLINLIKEHRNEDKFVPYLKEKPLGLAPALNYINIYTKEDINIWKERGRALQIHTDKKMKWSGIEKFDDFLINNFTGVRYTVKELIEKEKKYNVELDKMQKMLDEYN